MIGFAGVVVIVLVAGTTEPLILKRTVILKARVNPALRLVTQFDYQNDQPIRPRNGEMQVSLRFNGQDVASECSPPEGKAPPGTLCVDRLFGDDPPTSVRVEIVAPGYKRFSVNVPRLQFVRDTVTIDVGELRLERSALPTVAQITHSLQPNGSHQFDVILENVLQREFLVREVRLSSSLPDKSNIGCCCPPNAIFSISQTLTVSAGGERKRSASGSFQELVQGKTNVFAARGAVELDGCRGGVDLELSMPAKFTLPSKEFTAVQIILPPRFRIVESYFGIRGRPWGEVQARPNSEIIAEGRVDRFRVLRFEFVTALPDELAIIAAYDLVTGRIAP